MRRTRRILVVAAMLCGLSVLVPAQADAWLTSSTVTLQGVSNCGNNKTSWVWVEGSNGERGWATNGKGNYKFTFKKVPASNTMKVRVNYGNGTFRCTDYFGLNRPKVGSTQTRNVIRLLPNA